MNKSKNQPSVANWIMGFVVFDLTIALITVVTWRAKDSQQIINEISLWSGLASILLALVAIGYAYLQAYQSTRQSIEVQNTLEKINERVEEISTIKAHLIEIKDKQENIQIRLKSSPDNLDNTQIKVVD